MFAGSMLEAYHLRAADYLVKPWKNGQGESREISSDDSEPFRWRLSTAVLDRAGPFSSYPGYDRAIVILSGGPVRIQHEDKAPKPLLPLTRHAFKGEWHTIATPTLPAEDFNLFCLRDQARGNIYPSSIARGEELQLPIAGQEHFVFCVAGTLEIAERNLGRQVALVAGETFRLSRRTTKEFINLKVIGGVERSSFLWVVVHLLEKTKAKAKK